MHAQNIFALDLSLQAPGGGVEGQDHVDTTSDHITLNPECDVLCVAHDFQEMRWRYLDFFSAAAWQRPPAGEFHRIDDNQKYFYENSMCCRYNIVKK